MLSLFIVPMVTGLVWPAPATAKLLQRTRWAGEHRRKPGIQG